MIMMWKRLLASIAGTALVILLLAALPANLNDREYQKFQECATGIPCTPVSTPSGTALDVSTPAGSSIGTSPTQRGTLFNTRSVSGVNAAVSTTITAATSERGHVYRIDARCSAGTAALEIESPTGTVLWDRVAAASFDVTFPTGWTSAVNTTITVELATCGAGNTGTLIVQADRY